MPQIARLYYSPALLTHWVAEDTDGALWLLPVSPLSPRAWEARRPYHGNYELTPVVPQTLIEHYQPQSAHKLLRVGEAAARADCSDVTIRTAADRGDLPVEAYIGKRRERRFRPEDVDAWMAGKRRLEDGMKFVWSNQKSKGVEFEAHDLQSFISAGKPALETAKSEKPGQTLWCAIQTTDSGRWNGVDPVFHQPGYTQEKPGVVLRGYGTRFQPVTDDPTTWAQAWASLARAVVSMGFGSVTEDGAETTPLVADECGGPRTPEQKDLQSQYDLIVGAARSQRLQVLSRSPKLPAHRAEQEERDRADSMADMGRRYRAAAEKYKPGTDWMDWAAYVRATAGNDDIAAMVIHAVCPEIDLATVPSKWRDKGEIDWFDEATKLSGEAGEC